MIALQYNGVRRLGDGEHDDQRGKGKAQTRRAGGFLIRVGVQAPRTPVPLTPAPTGPESSGPPPWTRWAARSGRMGGCDVYRNRYTLVAFDGVAVVLILTAGGWLSRARRSSAASCSGA